MGFVANISLSACETALGEDIQGEGMVGVTGLYVGWFASPNGIAVAGRSE